MAEHDAAAEDPGAPVEAEPEEAPAARPFWKRPIPYILAGIAVVIVTFFLFPGHRLIPPVLGGVAALATVGKFFSDNKAKDAKLLDECRHTLTTSWWRDSKNRSTHFGLAATAVCALGVYSSVSGTFAPPASATSQSAFQRSVEHSQSSTNQQLTQLNQGVHKLENRPIASDPTDSTPQAQIVKLTGTYSEKGFHDAIEQPGSDQLIKLYVQSGFRATTLINGASAILYGFQDGLGNDPLALLKSFQASGFKLSEDLTDGTILPTDGSGLLPFQGPLAPKGYTGGYFVSDADPTGVFVGTLLFWIVEKDMINSGPTDQDTQILSYLISQGADCSVPLAFLDFNRSTLSGTSNLQDLYPMIKACAHSS
jgi:hypothetical protein